MAIMLSTLANIPAAKFSDFAGSYLAPDDEIVLVVKDASEVEGLVRQLVRIGFDRVTGCGFIGDRLRTIAIANSPSKL